jgi:hypothetical protein
MANLSIRDEIDTFVHQVDSIGGVIIAMQVALQEITKNSRAKLNEYQEKNCSYRLEGTDKVVVVPQNEYFKWKKLRDRTQRYEHSRILLPRILIVGLVSQYDGFLSRLLRKIYLSKPELLNTITKEISLADLLKFESMQDVKEFVLECEIESILRESHVQHFKILEKRFSIQLTKDLESWPDFVELTERRNLFVHTDGVVSSQYIKNCRNENCKIDKDIKEGTQLDVSQKYFENAYECIFEIGVKLGHVLWRKILPEQSEDCDSSYNDFCYNLISEKRYALALKLLEFAIGCFRTCNEKTRLMMIINQAQCFKWLGRASECTKVLDQYDWSVKSSEFKLAYAVLTENWSEAAEHMKQIGSNGMMSKSSYSEFPLFTEFRSTKEFVNTYKEVFGEPFETLSLSNTEIKPEKERSLRSGALLTE